MIKFSHTVFALPFAMAAVVIAYRDHAFAWQDILWIVLAMAGARSAAMGFNRIIDADIDKRNPRTALREIPAGKLTMKEAVFFVIFSAALFVFSAAMLSRLCFFLSFPVLLVLFFYSYTKRFTSLCHLVLGVAISMAPMGAYLAVADTLTVGIISLSLALMTYIAGFDILYACQDIEFDQAQTLFSLPSKLGAKKAMAVSGILHGLTVFFLVVMYILESLHPVFLFFLAVIVLLLVIEHRLVQPDNLSRIDVAFFHINSVISLLLFIGIMTQALLS